MQPVSVWQWSPWGLLLCLLCSSLLGSPSPSTAPEKRAGSQGLRFRLAGFPRKPFEGRVEIQRAGEWGTICDDDFTLQAAHVLCHELGFTEATGWTHSAKYGPGTGEQGSMCNLLAPHKEREHQDGTATGTQDTKNSQCRVNSWLTNQPIKSLLRLGDIRLVNAFSKPQVPHVQND